MKTLFKSLKITLVFCVFFSVFYILVLWLFAQVAGPNKGNACLLYTSHKMSQENLIPLSLRLHCVKRRMCHSGWQPLRVICLI